MENDKIMEIYIIPCSIDYPIIIINKKKYEEGKPLSYWYRNSHNKKWKKQSKNFLHAHFDKREPTKKERKAILKDFALWRMNV